MQWSNTISVLKLSTVTTWNTSAIRSIKNATRHIQNTGAVELFEGRLADETFLLGWIDPTVRKSIVHTGSIDKKRVGLLADQTRWSGGAEETVGGTLRLNED